jgi:hypothetical protein
MLFGREITLTLQAQIPQPRETNMDQGTSDDYMDHLKNKNIPPLIRMYL